ncbi:hypothetical protein J1614_005404 [Plenodomus biglobosus]|nr:hypothetical protein J1614_005404 [Plenodomus biglobosus]
MKLLLRIFSRLPGSASTEQSSHNEVYSGLTIKGSLNAQYAETHQSTRSTSKQQLAQLSGTPQKMTPVV